MKNITFKSLFIFCSIVLISAPLFSVVSCAKKKPPESVVQKPAVSAEDEAKKRAEEDVRLKAEEERKKAEEDAARAKEEEIKKKAEEEKKLKAEEEAKARAAEEAKAGEEAKEAAKETPKGEVAAGKTSHEVIKGESLWKIAKHKNTYENPFMWPIIYKANHDKINDPDLIYPKQVLSIPREFSSVDKDKAVRHAKHRGEWSLHDGPEKYWEPGYKKK